MNGWFYDSQANGEPHYKRLVVIFIACELQQLKKIRLVEVKNGALSMVTDQDFI